LNEPQTVSIPVGFFQALQHPAGQLVDLILIRVSIPVGFFQALQRGELHIEKLLVPVSIPVGFFQALQRA